MGAETVSVTSEEVMLPLLVTVTNCGPVENVEPTGPMSLRVSILPFVHESAGPEIVRFIVPDVICCRDWTASLNVAVAPAPMRAKDATPREATVKNLRDRAMRVSFHNEI